MARRDTAVPRVISSDGAAMALTPIELTDRRVDEGWLQKLLHSYPGVLPVDEIGPGWGPLVSIGREIQTNAGNIDNLFISPSGELTIVEAKLWRNPEARRTVVGQILDYAAALSQLDYEELDVLVERADDDGPGGGIWQRVCESTPSLDDTGESAFVDRVSSNLAAGRFLLLVVGDGIRSNLENIAHLLTRPGLTFHLELIELSPFHWHDDEHDDERILVVPRLIGHTAEVVVGSTARAAAPTDTDTIDLREKRVARDRTPMASMDEFAERLTAAAGIDETERVLALIDWWRDDCDGHVRLNKASVNLSATYSPNRQGKVSVLTIGTDGTATASVEPLAEWSEVISRPLVEQCCGDAGFKGNPQWPTRPLDLATDASWDQMTTMLARIANEVANAEAAATADRP